MARGQRLHYFPVVCSSNARPKIRGIITSHSSSNANQLKPLSTLCEACDSDLGNYSLALVFEDTSTQQRIKRRGVDLRKLRFQESFPPITLSELLDGSTKLDPREKRTLALIFAESLLLYHDSAWMSANGGGWAKLLPNKPYIPSTLLLNV